MKHFAPRAMMLLFTFIATTTYSQTKPKQFSNYPDIINCPETQLANIFNSVAGQNINLAFSDNFSFSGDVLNNVVKYSNLQSAVIKSPAFNNSIFSISKIVNADNSVSYVGRILNKNYYDGYELKKSASGKYQLIKVETDQVIQDCRQQ